MKTVYVLLIVFAGILALLFSLSYFSFRKTFYVKNSKKIHPEFELPKGEIYLPYKDVMLSWMKEAKTFKREKIYIKSFDNLTLSATYYEFFKDAPLEIMFHGYRGSAERDLCGGLQRCIKLKRNVLTVNQRGNGESDGNVISFGIKERFDALSWARYASNRFGENTSIFFTGISMGASTVIMASSLDLPKNVIGIIADCGYSSIKDIIKIVIKKKKLPVSIFYPLVKMGALIFGGFNIEKASPKGEAEKSKVPILFIHGDVDDFVPHYMSEENYNACKTEKMLVTFNGAGHGIAYLSDPEKYLSTLIEFEKICKNTP